MVSYMNFMRKEKNLPNYINGGKEEREKNIEMLLDTDRDKTLI